MVGFDIVEGKYNFKTDYRFFELSEEWKQWFNHTKETYAIDKENHLGSGYKYKKEGLNLGGKPSWWQADETPLDPDGVPMEFVSEFGYDEKMFYLFYSHKDKLAVQIYQIT